MSTSTNAVAMLVLNRPVTGTDEHWVVQLDQDSEESSGEATEQSKIPLHEGSILRIGRASSNDIVVRSKLASRFHALVSVTRNGVVVCDLDSLNGSFINGYRIDAPQDISNGDTLRIGPVEFHVQMGISRDVEKAEKGVGRNEVQPVDVLLFMADIRDYRQKLAATSPEAITPLVRHWFADAREAITENDGHIDRFLGDGVIAYWFGPSESRRAMFQKGLRAAGQLQAKTNSIGKMSTAEDVWSCTITLVGNSALAVADGADGCSSLVLGSVLNELFAINTFAKRSDIEMSCNQFAGETIKEFVSLKPHPDLQTTAVVGELVKPIEILAAKGGV